MGTKKSLKSFSEIDKNQFKSKEKVLHSFSEIRTELTKMAKKIEEEKPSETIVIDDEGNVSRRLEQSLNHFNKTDYKKSNNYLTNALEIIALDSQADDEVTVKIRTILRSQERLLAGEIIDKESERVKLRDLYTLVILHYAHRERTLISRLDLSQFEVNLPERVTKATYIEGISLVVCTSSILKESDEVRFISPTIYLVKAKYLIGVPILKDSESEYERANSYAKRKFQSEVHDFRLTRPDSDAAWFVILKQNIAASSFAWPDNITFRASSSNENSPEHNRLKTAQLRDMRLGFENSYKALFDQWTQAKDNAAEFARKARENTVKFKDEIVNLDSKVRIEPAGKIERLNQVIEEFYSRNKPSSFKNAALISSQKVKFMQDMLNLRNSILEDRASSKIWKDKAVELEGQIEKLRQDYQLNSERVPLIRKV